MSTISARLTRGSASTPSQVDHPRRLVAALGTAGVPGLFHDDCLQGGCAGELAEELDRPFPAGVPYVSVYSRSDWVVDWHACLDPAAENVEVDSSHIGMSVHPEVYRLLGRRLADLAARTAAPA